MSVLLLNQPSHYFELFDDFPATATIDEEPGSGPYDLVHFFTTSKKELHQLLPVLRQKVAQNGAIWVSWPKGKSKIEKDLNENDVRDCMLAIEMVDVKVCAVDDDWSGLKGVIRVENRR